MRTLPRARQIELERNHELSDLERVVETEFR